ncbi:hypothetical protein [Rhodospirillaceae bacterium SYSU D60014]|uniref:hypothetical protein n=1 Tax=Virgifigura deserti TaxID=2268457 RepID=UPI000E65F7A2
MTNTPGILLLPPPAAPVATATKADRAAALLPIAPAQPLRADKDRDVASDHLGFRQSDSSARNGAAAAKQAGGGERWLPASLVEAEPQETGSRRAELPFLAQQIAQEALSSGLHREPWEAGLAAYRRAGGEPPLPASEPPLVRLSA